MNWIHLDGNPKDGFYVADAFGPGNPGGVDTAGSYFCQNKFSRYLPDGRGGSRVGLSAGSSGDGREEHPDLRALSVSARKGYVAR